MKIFGEKLRARRAGGFTLVEVLVAVSIFTVAAVMATGIMVDVVQLQKKSSVQNGLYEDARTILQQLTKEIQNGTVDYEEYYNMNVIQAAKTDSNKFYGINYGVYASRFFDPGKSLNKSPIKDLNPAVYPKNPDDLGIECAQIGSDGKCEVYYNYSSDFNTGQNPYNKKTGSDTSAKANAFCDSTAVDCSKVSNQMDELYLIDSTGTKKTIIGRKKMKTNDNGVAEDWALGVVRMQGADLDQNGVIDVFGCTPDFNCYGDYTNIAIGIIKYPFVTAPILTDNKITLPKKSDLSDSFLVSSSQFIPITPKRTTVKSVKFIINPIEDPYKAYGEAISGTNPNVQSQPSVTILLTLNLAADVAKDYPGKFEDFTIQTTVAAGVIGKIDSYPPVNDVLQGSGAASWIKGVLPSNVNN